MRKFFFLFISTLKRVFLSKSFWGACAGLAIMSLISIYEESVTLDGMETSVLYLYEIGTYANFWILYLLFAAIPGSALFCSDWENRFFRSSIVRCTKRIYGAATACACFISALVTVMVGEWLFIGVLWLRYPLIIEESVLAMGLDHTVYAALMNSTSVLLYFMIRICIKAFCAAFCSVFALWLSTWITNIFVALTSPIILFYFLENVGAIFQLPGQLQITTLAKGHLMAGESLSCTLLYPVFLFLAFGSLFGVFFAHRAKERVENG